MKEKEYKPNQISPGISIKNLIMSGLLLGYGIHGLLKDDIFIPGSSSNGVHFHGGPAWILFAAFLCAICNLIATVIDHYDRRNNKKKYQLLLKITNYIG